MLSYSTKFEHVNSEFTLAGSRIFPDISADGFEISKTKAECYRGIPPELACPEQMFDPSQRNCLIFDDLQNEVQQSVDVTNMLTRGTHHLNVCTFVIQQTLFSRKREARTQALQAHYLIIWRSPRDKGNLDTLARQLGPDFSRRLQYACHDWLSTNRHNYVVLDLTGECDECRVVANIISDSPQSDPPFIFL